MFSTPFAWSRQRWFLFGLSLSVASLSVDVLGVGQVTQKVAAAIESKTRVTEALRAYDLADTELERAQALTALEPLAEGGDSEAIRVVAGHYTENASSAADLQKAFRLFLIGAESEDSFCLLMAGVMYGSGEGGEVDLAKAHTFLDRAIEAGSAEAYKAKAHLLLKPETFEEAKALLMKASELGVVDADVYLGEIYHYGEFCDTDPIAALGYYEKAMAGGDAHSAIMVGDYYVQGLAGSRDSSKGYAAFLRAKELGENRAWNRLGRLYMYGEGVSFDIKLAVAHFKKGIELGDRESMIWLGLAYAYPGADFEDTEDCYLWSFVSAEMGVEMARDYNQELSSYLSSKARDHLEAKAAPIIASLKGEAP